ncbi:hypothetical protein [Flavobacterium cellulosilyticum]|uniref:PKD domain-containing protein n=1 Tax=Flavobacterium cellulosilyticum TaxID=2541731 RepID=A0A4R5CA07_9FLAO|nr:hypothetical protein [Flavobacterium cellulosilyticum]TDD95516.1 hypothetical protein E0F76_13700 [Flavobacterium cellulosilyticum]
MKNIKLIFSFVLLLAVTISCSIPDGIDQDTSFLNTAVSGNISKIFDISTDNSGIVKITPTGEGVTSYTVNYGHGTGAAASAVVVPGASTSHVYPEGSYTVSIVATDIAGHKTTSTAPLVVTYRAPENVTITISGEMKVKAVALYAKSFLVYYGDVANEVGTPMAIGQELPAHIYPASGSTPYTLKVEALSGGVAKTAATKTLFDLPIDFETADVDFFGTFDDIGQQLFSTVDNPSKTGINTSAKVGKYTNGHASWSGTYSPLNIPINFAYGKKIKVMVYNPSAANIGKKLNIELEAAIGGTPANGVAIVKMPFTTSGAWEELTFDFSGISGIPAGTKFGQLVLRFNDSQNGSQEVFYVDNFKLTN